MMPPYFWAWDYGDPKGDFQVTVEIPVRLDLSRAEKMIEAVDWDAVREERLRQAHKPYQGDMGDEA